MDAVDPLLDDAAPVPLPASIRPIPESVWASMRAWWGHAHQHTAEAELHLYQSTPYFRGATLGNARHVSTPGPDGMVDAYALARDKGTSDAPVLPGNEYATAATQPASDGKIGVLRAVDLTSQSTTSSMWGLWRRHAPARYVHMLEVGKPEPQAARPADETQVVLVHGYGAGSAFFFKNVQALASAPNSRLYALDWLGMGRSARVPYVMSHAPRSDERVEASETFFMDALEDWRKAMNIDKMVLVGHSLGGYLSTVYALRHPERVSDLILVSPVGFPEGSLAQMLGRGEDEDGTPRPRMNSTFVRTATWLWERNVSPFGIVRYSTILGPWLTGRYTRRRFHTLKPDEVLAMHTYCHGIFTGRGSSEHCLVDLLAPGAFARKPLVHRVAPLQMPVTFLYGSHDWMDVNGGRQAQAVLERAGNRHVRVQVVPKAGHHLYLDNAPETNRWLQQALRRFS